SDTLKWWVSDRGVRDVGKWAVIAITQGTLRPGAWITEQFIEHATGHFGLLGSQRLICSEPLAGYLQALSIAGHYEVSPSVAHATAPTLNLLLATIGKLKAQCFALQRVIAASSGGRAVSVGLRQLEGSQRVVTIAEAVHTSLLVCYKLILARDEERIEKKTKELRVLVSNIPWFLVDVLLRPLLEQGLAIRLLIFAMKGVCGKQDPFRELASRLELLTGRRVDINIPCPLHADRTSSNKIHWAKIAIMALGTGAVINTRGHSAEVWQSFGWMADLDTWRNPIAYELSSKGTVCGTMKRLWNCSLAERHRNKRPSLPVNTSEARPTWVRGVYMGWCRWARSRQTIHCTLAAEDDRCVTQSQCTIEEFFCGNSTLGLILGMSSLVPTESALKRGADIGMIVTPSHLHFAPGASDEASDMGDSSFIVQAAVKQTWREHLLAYAVKKLRGGWFMSVAATDGDSEEFPVWKPYIPPTHGPRPTIAYVHSCGAAQMSVLAYALHHGCMVAILPGDGADQQHLKSLVGVGIGVVVDPATIFVRTERFTCANLHAIWWDAVPVELSGKSR
ncbi:uncharacterized protein VTP21DRAFT_2587, partial [Calcarisporiella thermophila]|uniref:uncharacterized protein n=1 Tax=Calcarisporiella thermophila TaxID=911321 RepID=UPI003743ADA7